MHPNHGLHLDNAGGDLDEAQAQRVELGDAPHRAFRHRDAKSPHQPIGAGGEEEAELIGGRLGAGRAIRRQMGLPGFDVVFGLAAEIDVFVKPARVAMREIGDDEAGVGPFRADFDPGDDALDAAPTLRAVEELLEATELAVARRGLEPHFRAGFEIGDMTTQRRRSAPRRGCSRGHWRDTSRAPRGRNSGCRREAGSRFGANEPGSRATAGGEKA